MDQPPPPPRIGKMWWWYGIFVLLSLILLYGPIRTCNECNGKGLIVLPPGGPKGVTLRCFNCYGLGRVGLLRQGR